MTRIHGSATGRTLPVVTADPIDSADDAEAHARETLCRRPNAAGKAIVKIILKQRLCILQMLADFDEIASLEQRNGAAGSSSGRGHCRCASRAAHSRDITGPYRIISGLRVRVALRRPSSQNHALHDHAEDDFRWGATARRIRWRSTDPMRSR